MTEPILFSAKQVNGFQPGLFSKRKFCLKNINFSLPAGYIMGLVGKNGAGKTTFFDYIMEEKKHYSGELLLEGEEIHDNPIKTLEKVGFISEKQEFLELRTARQNAQMLGRFYTHFDLDRFERIMEQFALSSQKNVGNLSRGELTKFQLAFAAAHRPKLFLIDEATAGMDPVFRIDFYQMLHQLLAEENCSVILTTQIEEEIEKQLDYVGILEEGNFISFGEVGKVNFIRKENQL